MPTEGDGVSAFLRLRVGHEDVHYGGGLVAGAFVMRLLGDLATEVTIKSDGDEGLLRAYESVEFLAPVFAGDYLEAEGTLVKRGRTSRTIDFSVCKVAEAVGGESRARMLNEKVLVARARGTTVVVPEGERAALDHVG